MVSPRVDTYCSKKNSYLGLESHIEFTFFFTLKAHQNSWRTKWCRSYKRMWLWKKTL